MTGPAHDITHLAQSPGAQHDPADFRDPLHPGLRVDGDMADLDRQVRTLAQSEGLEYETALEQLMGWPTS